MSSEARFLEALYYELQTQGRRRLVGHEHEYAPCDDCFRYEVGRARFNVTARVRLVDPLFVAPLSVDEIVDPWKHEGRK